MKTNPPRRSHHRAASEKQFPARTACAARLRWLLLLLLLTLPAVVQAQFNYTTNNGTITITGYTGPGGAVVIPDTINGLPVTRIGVNAFFYRAVTSVSIPNSVTSIGDYAFYGCFSLTSVTMGNSVTSIGDLAFESCANLTSVMIPNSVTNIGAEAFGSCSSLSSVTIPNNVTTIGGNAFAGCTSLTSITIPTSVTSIGSGAFLSCISLSAITVDALNSFYSSVDGILFNKSQTLLIQCPGGKAGSYTIPNSVTNIGNYAFSVCTSLTSVTIPTSVTSIGNSAFGFCTSLSAITVDALNSVYSSMDGVLFDKDHTLLIECPGGKTGSYTIPNTVTNIGNTAFSGCTSLTNVTIPNSVTNIGTYAFWSCTSLTSATIGNGVTSIGTYAFYACSSLTSATIPNSVTNIGTYAFSGCSSLTSVTIPNSVIGIGDGTFSGCTGLTNVTIPNSVTSIGVEAFGYCSSLTGVYFQGNAPYFGYEVFVDADDVIVYYLPGTTDWGTTSADRPTLLWNPQVQTGNASFGVRTNRFGFTITGTTNIPIVVEATTNLAHGPWVPLQSLNLTNGAFYFSDPQWTNYPARFYRLRSP